VEDGTRFGVLDMPFGRRGPASTSAVTIISISASTDVMARSTGSLDHHRPPSEGTALPHGAVRHRRYRSVQSYQEAKG
jgi:hypothetical protein